MSVPHVERPRAICPGCGARVNEQPRGNVPSRAHLQTEKCVAARKGKVVEWVLSPRAITLLRAANHPYEPERNDSDMVGSLKEIGLIERVTAWGRPASGARHVKTTEAGREWLAGFDGRKR